MWALPWILPPGAPYWIGAIVDASALAVICGPLLWFTSVRPVRRLAILAAGEYVQILDHAADAIIVIDEKGRIETFNAAAERAFGYAAKEALDHNVSMLMSSPHSQDHDGYLQRYSQTGVRHVIGMSREVVGKRRTGASFPARFTSASCEPRDGVSSPALSRTSRNARRNRPSFRNTGTNWPQRMTSWKHWPSNWPT